MFAEIPPAPTAHEKPLKNSELFGLSAVCQLGELIEGEFSESPLLLSELKFWGFFVWLSLLFKNRLDIRLCAFRRGPSKVDSLSTGTLWRMNPHAGDKELSDLLDFSAVSISWKISDTLAFATWLDVAIGERCWLHFINDRICFACWQFFCSDVLAAGIHGWQ